MLMCAAVVVGIGVAPAAHAQSIAPMLNVTLVQWGGYDQFNIVGMGFTPGSPVQVTITNALTGAVLATGTAQTDTTTTVTVALSPGACAQTDSTTCINGLPAWWVAQYCTLQPTLGYAGISYQYACPTISTSTIYAAAGHFGTAILVPSSVAAPSVTVSTTDVATNIASTPVTLAGA
jgi:hypothetical protein